MSYVLYVGEYHGYALACVGCFGLGGERLFFTGAVVGAVGYLVEPCAVGNVIRRRIRAGKLGYRIFRVFGYRKAEYLAINKFKIQSRNTGRTRNDPLALTLVALEDVYTVFAQIFKVNRKGKLLIWIDIVALYYLFKGKGNVVLGLLIVLLVGIQHGLRLL